MKKAAVIGCGLIGQGWATLFARAGIDVTLHDKSPVAARNAVKEISANCSDLQEWGLIEDGRALIARLSVSDTLATAVAEADYVQESVAEIVKVKSDIFVELDALTAPHAILASSCSSIPPDAFMHGLTHPERCLVAHPFSPVHLIPLVELVPSSWTSTNTVMAVEKFLEGLGQRPILIRKAVVGYAVNRLQAAVIAEALALVREGVISPEDLDACMKDGLGRRWAFIGPFETMDLNSEAGFLQYVAKFYAGGYRAICSDLKVHEPWADSALQDVERWRRSQLADRAALIARRQWRDCMLARIDRAVKAGREP